MFELLPLGITKEMSDNKYNDRRATFKGSCAQTKTKIIFTGQSTKNCFSTQKIYSGHGTTSLLSPMVRQYV
jgi:hypothetical protein